MSATESFDFPGTLPAGAIGSPRRYTLCFSGEWDISTTSVVRDQVLAHIAGSLSHDVVILDISEVSFCDASGVRAVLAVTAAADNAGMALQVVGAQPIVARIFGIVGLHDLLESRVGT